MLEYGRDRKDGILSDICMSMLEAGAGTRKEGFDELGFSQFAQEAQGVTSNVFVRVL